MASLTLNELEIIVCEMENKIMTERNRIFEENNRLRTFEENARKHRIKRTLHPNDKDKLSFAERRAYNIKIDKEVEEIKREFYERLEPLPKAVNISDDYLKEYYIAKNALNIYNAMNKNNSTDGLKSAQFKFGELTQEEKIIAFDKYLSKMDVNYCFA